MKPMSNTQITACSKCVKSWMTGQNMDTASSHWPPEEQGKVYFWRPKAEIFHQSFTLCPMIMPSMNGSPYSSTQIFLCISILNISRATHCRSVLCQKADHPDVAQLSEKVWSALPIQLTNWRISWPWARSESLSPPSKTIGASWEMVVVRTSTFHWSWCRKVPRQFESMAVCHRRSMQWYDASFWIWRKVVELYNCEILQNTWNLWQIGRLVGQDYGSGEEDWCLSRWEA